VRPVHALFILFLFWHRLSSRFSRFRPSNANLCTPPVSPQVRLNGYALKPPELRRLSGYVLQDDILPAMLTVNTHNKKP
jgi:hypothetical protein